MKLNKILLTLAVILPSALFSYDLSFSKKFSKNVSADLLTTNVNVSIEDKDEAFINENIEKINKFVKNYNKVVKKDGSYTLNPKYKYTHDGQKFLGYVGSLRYKLESSNAKDLNEFISKLIELKKQKPKKTKLNFSNLSWTVSDDLYSSNVDNLRVEAITWAENYTKSLSNTLNKNCVLKNININAVSNFVPRVGYAMAEMSSKRSINVAPVNTNKEISINPSFVMECK